MRLKDADTLIESIEQSKGKNSIYAQFVRAYIKDAPTIDAVPVVRCKDCVWYVRSMIKQDGTIDERYKPDWCDLYRRVREETYFCADGEREDDEID